MGHTAMIRRAEMGYRVMKVAASDRNILSIHIIEDTYLFIVHTNIVHGCPEQACNIQSSSLCSLLHSLFNVRQKPVSVPMSSNQKMI